MKCSPAAQAAADRDQRILNDRNVGEGALELGVDHRGGLLTEIATGLAATFDDRPRVGGREVLAVIRERDACPTRARKSLSWTRSAKAVAAERNVVVTTT